MEIKRFDINNDLNALEDYLREMYFKNQNMTSWLPERLHDLIYRMDMQYIHAGKEKSSDYIFMWMDKGKIVGCILPDGDAIYISVKNGYENIYEKVVSFAEENTLPLFTKDNDGYIDFLVIANDSEKYKGIILEKNGYKKQVEEDYDNCVDIESINVNIDLPKGFKLLFKDEYKNEVNKWSACNLGFHPDLESPDYKNNMDAYESRKNSSMYNDSFECIIIDDTLDEGNNVCSYSFVYVDKITKTAFIEPVSTRVAYRHLGLGTAMMHGIMLKCKELGIEKCFVNSYDWRVKFYNASGFTTIDSIGYYHKKIK